MFESHQLLHAGPLSSSCRHDSEFPTRCAGLRKNTRTSLPPPLPLLRCSVSMMLKSLPSPTRRDAVSALCLPTIVGGGGSGIGPQSGALAAAPSSCGFCFVSLLKCQQQGVLGFVCMRVVLLVGPPPADQQISPASLPDHWQQQLKNAPVGKRRVLKR